jgi:hypothetical protein
MQWQVHGHRDVYDSPWVRVSLDDVEVPGGDRFEHHVLHFPRSATPPPVHLVGARTRTETVTTRRSPLVMAFSKVRVPAQRPLRAP